ncbi:gliding motility-associated C-terminal domain-containing protein [Bacteroidia bacterium]|nr:gliding motility-associated C-terminal domain-containing protein [Bacteroidia bacterium]
MRISLIISFILCFLATNASHLIGGEITYTYVSQNKYKINVTLYRDCGEAKLGTQGGGTSTTSRNDLAEAYIRTTTNACGNKNIGSISLSKVGFEDITPLCNKDYSKCGTNSVFPFGIEAHHYSGIVDFSNYNSYQGCGFIIFIAISERNSDITTLSTEEDDLYNYVYINPWKENVSSPQFVSSPKIIFNVNQAVYDGDYASTRYGDSIVYKWAQPLKSHNTPIPYSSGYSNERFIDVYCPSSSTCTANPKVYPPQGAYLNDSTGEFIFTPTSQNSIGVRVIEIEQWRSSNNVSYLASIIRRDVLSIIKTNNGNGTPQIIASDNYNLCVGQLFSTKITATDINPTNGTISQDTVIFSLDNKLDSLSATSTNLTTAPYQELLLEFTPTSVDIGTHYIRVSARDNNCPEYAQSHKTIRITVKPKPTVSLEVDDLFCGNNLISLTSDRSTNYSAKISNSNAMLYNDAIDSGYSFKHNKPEILDYKVYFEDDFGCIDSISLQKNNLGSSVIEPASLAGQTILCDGDSLELSLVHSKLSISDIEWGYHDLHKEDIYTEQAENGKLYFHYDLIQDDLKCRILDSIEINVLPKPTLSIGPLSPICFRETLDMSLLATSPKTGVWIYNNQTTTSLNLASLIPNMDTSIILTYKVTDEKTGCTAQAEVEQNILEGVELELAHQRICGNQKIFRLSNSIVNPFFGSSANITWNMLDNYDALINTPFPSLDIANYGSNTYTVEGTHSLFNGCTAVDTAIILVDSNLVLSSNDTRQICQSNVGIDLNSHFEINVPGGIWQIDGDYTFSGDTYVPDNCKDLIFKYFYYKNDCHDELEIPINIMCKPSFDLAIPTSICNDNPTLNLSPQYNWSLNNQEINSLNPRNNSFGTLTLLASKETAGCTFDSLISISIVEPIAYSIKNIPSHICEGQNLELEVDRKDYTNLKIDFCSSVLTVNSGEKIAYQPTACDLVSNNISATITSYSEALCPSHTSIISIPYYSAPEVNLPKPIFECEPFNIDIQLELKEGLNPEINYTVESADSKQSGNGLRIKHNSLHHGKYSLRMNTEDENGCNSKQYLPNFATIWATPSADFSMANKQRLSLSEREIYLYNYTNLSSGNFTNKWYYKNSASANLFSDQSNPTYKLPADTGIFNIILVANSENNCTDTAIQNVLIVPDIIAFIPSAFTPNNKGPHGNEVFKITSDHAASFNIDIYNRWGQKVFNSNDIRDSWNGTFNGQFCQNGVYLYSINLINHTGLEYTYQGTVNLIR